MSIVRVPFSLTGGGAASYVPAGAILLDGSADFFDIELGASGSTTKITVSMGIKLAGAINGNNSQVLYAAAGGVGTNGDVIYYFGSGHGTHPNEIGIALDGGSTCVAYLPGKFRDPTAHFRLTVAIDLGQSTDATKVKAWINDESQTLTFSTSCSETAFKFFLQSGTSGGGTISQSIGGWDYLSGYWFGGILSDCVIVANQQLDDTYFVTRDANNGIALVDPTAAVALGGTATTWLRFADSADLGYNENQTTGDWTLNSIIPANATNDNPADDAANGFGNYATLNAIYESSNATLPTLSNGNLTADSASGSGPASHAPATIPLPSSGKYGFKVTYNSGTWFAMGVAERINWPSSAGAPQSSSDFDGLYQDGTDIEVKDGGSTASSGHTKLTAGQYCECLVDLDAGTVKIYTNGSQIGSTITGISATNPIFVLFVEWSNVTVDFGQSGYTPTDSSYQTLCTANLPAPTVTDPSAYFQTLLWTGDSSSPRSITGFTDGANNNVTPDFVWVKSRSNASSHTLWDSVRGGGGSKELLPDASNEEGSQGTANGYLSTFDAGGFSVAAGSVNDVYTNESGRTYVAWCLKAGGAGSSNNDGSIPSTVSVAAHGGFSIGTYTGTGANATFGHGLSSDPDFFIIKCIDQAYSWACWHKDLTPGDYLVRFDNPGVESSQAGLAWQNNPIATLDVITLGSQTGQNSLNDTHVFYAFARVPGLIGIGKYTGNGLDDGPYVVVDDGGSGFRPAFLLIKNIDGIRDWQIYDNRRPGYNGDGANAKTLQIPTLTETNRAVDFTANGFKPRTTAQEVNNLGDRLIYLAFAEYPFGGDGVAQAKAR